VSEHCSKKPAVDLLWGRRMDKERERESSGNVG
jgi:hypothetical protein